MKSQILFLLFFFFLLSSINSQILFEENFDYEVNSNLSEHGWTEYNSGGAIVKISDANLSFYNYPSNSGQCVKITSDGVDYYKSLSSSVNSGVLYLSLLIMVEDATTATQGKMIFSLGHSQSSMGGKLFIKRQGSYFAFGISKIDEATFTDFIYEFNYTYLVVIKYTIVKGSQNDDVSLFVFNDTLPLTEPEPTIIHPTETKGDPSTISIVIIRQDANLNKVLIDGIRVATSWSYAPLPVELVSFMAQEENGYVKLNWQTATESENYGFEIERLAESYKNSWEKIGFVLGSVNSFSPKYYSFIDEIPLSGNLLYRLKQIDLDGSYKYCEIIARINYNITSLEDNKTPSEFYLYQNYPNPFNPSTLIKYSVPGANSQDQTHHIVSIKIYDLLGREIAALVNKYQTPGIYQVKFDAFNLPGGVYICSLKAGNFYSTRKMILIK